MSLPLPPLLSRFPLYSLPALTPPYSQDSHTSRAECLLEKAMIHQKRRDYRRACRELHEAIKIEKNNAQVGWDGRGGRVISNSSLFTGVSEEEGAAWCSVPNMLIPNPLSSL